MKNSRIESRRQNDMPSIPAMIFVAVIIGLVYDSYKHQDDPDQSTTAEVARLAWRTGVTIKNAIWPRLTTVCVVGDGQNRDLPDPLMIELPMLDHPILCDMSYGNRTCHVYVERDRQDSDHSLMVHVTADNTWVDLYRGEEVTCPEKTVCDLEMVWTDDCPAPLPASGLTPAERTYTNRPPEAPYLVNLD